MWNKHMKDAEQDIDVETEPDVEVDKLSETGLISSSVC